MGTALLLAEIERLRDQLAEAERLLAQERLLGGEQKKLVDQQALQLLEEKERVASLAASNEALAQRLALIEMKLKRKSERVSDDDTQLSMLPSDGPEPPPRLPAHEDDEEEKKSDEEKKEERKKKRIASGKSPRRRDLSEMDGIAKRQVPCPMDPAATCKKCSGPLTVIGQAAAWRIHWVAGHFERLEMLRDKCACPNCPSEGVLTVPDPSALPRSMCSNGTLSHVLVEKYADHIPLNRQARRMARLGFEISTAVLAAWVIAIAHPKNALLSRIADAISAEVTRTQVLLADDTGYPVQDGLDGYLRKGRLWAYTDQEQVVFRFTDDKCGHRISTILERYTGRVILVDAGSEFNKVVRELGVKRAGCWSHLRRYFFEARLHNPREAHLALRTIRDLFLLERSLDGAPAETVLEARQRDAKPLVEGFFAWVDKLSKTSIIRPGSLLGKALGYARNNRASFFEYLSEAGLPMNNNLSELLLRQPVVGRKNWLFSKTEGGAEAAAVMFTIIGSCMLQAIDPEAYLNDVLNRIHFTPANRLHELTPRNWRLARERAAAGASPAAA